MEEINRTNEGYWMVTAKVHVVASDRSVRKFEGRAFIRSSNLVKVTAPFVENVGDRALGVSNNLHDVIIGSVAFLHPGSFQYSLSHEVIAASVGFELAFDYHNKVYYIMIDDDSAVTRFWK